MKDNNSSAFTSNAWMAQQSAWEMTADLWESPLYIRDKGEKYLEKFAKENNLKYEARRLRSVPRNKFRESIETMAGMVFKADPAPEKVPDALKDLFTDIDAEGNSLHAFCITSFEKFLRDGGGAILVNATMLSDAAKEKAQNGEQLTAADRQGDRPFLNFIEARQIINHRYQKVNGVDVLMQVTIAFTEIEPDGEFGEIEVQKQLVLRPGEYIIYRQTDKDEWTVQESGGTGLNEIALVPLAPFGTPPPMLDMAMLTIKHYNMLSDFDEWVHYTCSPRQVLKFDNDSDAMKYGEVNQAVNVGMKIYGQYAEAFYLQPTADGMDVAKERIADVAAEIAGIGVGMLQPSQVAPKSATEVLDTAGQRQSKLARYAREFENSLEKAFYFIAEYHNIINGGSKIDLDAAEDIDVRLKMDFDKLTYDTDRIAFLKDLLMSGDLSHTTFYEMLPNFIEMPQGWTAEKERQRLSGEEPVIEAQQFAGEDVIEERVEKI